MSNNKRAEEQEFFFPVSSPTSCISSLLALSTRYFGHQPACLSSHRHLSIATHMHPNNISSATIHLNLPVNDNQQRDIPPQKLPAAPSTKMMFLGDISTQFFRQKDGSDQTKLFQPRGGSGQEANVKAYGENTCTTSI